MVNKQLMQPPSTAPDWALGDLLRATDAATNVMSMLNLSFLPFLSNTALLAGVVHTQMADASCVQVMSAVLKRWSTVWASAAPAASFLDTFVTQFAAHSQYVPRLPMPPDTRPTTKAERDRVVSQDATAAAGIIAGGVMRFNPLRAVPDLAYSNNALLSSSSSASTSTAAMAMVVNQDGKSEHDGQAKAGDAVNDPSNSGALLGLLGAASYPAHPVGPAGDAGAAAGQWVPDPQQLYSDPLLAQRLLLSYPAGTRNMPVDMSLFPRMPPMARVRMRDDSPLSAPLESYRDRDGDGSDRASVHSGGSRALSHELPEADNASDGELLGPLYSLSVQSTGAYNQMVYSQQQLQLQRSLYQQQQLQLLQQGVSYAAPVLLPGVRQFPNSAGVQHTPNTPQTQAGLEFVQVCCISWRGALLSCAHVAGACTIVAVSY